MVYLHHTKDGVRPGLPDGFFSNQKSKFWVNFRGPYVGLFFGHFGIFSLVWVPILHREKSGNPAYDTTLKK
jgi:hypothetical protein